MAFVLSDIARDDARMHEADFATEPSLASGSAVAAAFDVVPDAVRSGLDAETPILMIYEPSVIGGAGPSRLVWHVRVKSAAGDVNQVVLVDAASGAVAFTYSDIKHAKNRSIYDHNNVAGSVGTLVITEGNVPGGAPPEAVLAYQYLGDTYDFYSTRFGRDSYDGAGAALVGRVRFCEPGYSCPYANAYWNGTEMRFGDGFAAADDVVAHELTHAVTERESNLIYWGESGAINEAFSDIFGEFVDLTNTGGTDTAGVRWLMGEDAPGGAIRSMSDPTFYGDPDRRFGANWYTGAEDNRGVHVNSGVANKLAYLLTDGGPFNGQTVTGQGISPVAGLFYEAQANLLVPASDYFDLYAALRQAAKNLSWAAASRGTLEAASRAVEINLPGNPVTVFSDGFEGTFPGSWQVIDQGGPPPYSGIHTEWGRSAYRKATGSASAWCAAGGTSPSPAGGNYKPEMDTWMVYGPFPLSSTTQAWAEFDVYLDVEYPFDEIFWGVSTDGVNFDGYPVSPGPDGTSVGVTGAPGWSHELFNFKEIPGTLGQAQVWLAFQFVSDPLAGTEYEGAYVDNVVISKAPTAAPFGSFDYPANGSSSPGGTVALQGWALDDLGVTQVQIYRDPVGGETPGPNGKVLVGDATQVPGLRPDVEAVYPNYPYVYKAGWSYDLLTGPLPSGGVGTFTFYAYALDADGRSSLLGSRTLTFSGIPGITIDDRSVPSGGAVAAAFRTYLSFPLGQAVTVNYSTVDGTALAGVDYVSTAGTLTFSAGRQYHSIQVPILSISATTTKTFTVVLSAPVNATISDGTAIGTITTAPAPAVIPMYRAYNLTADYHFFTTFLAEKNNAVANGYRDESNPLPFSVPNTQVPGATPLFRLYNPNNGRHYYTASAGERDFLMGLGYVYERDEGFVYTSLQAGTTEVFKLYNRNSGAHLYTAIASEKDAILAMFPGIWEQHTSLGWAVP